MVDFNQSDKNDTSTTPPRSSAGRRWHLLGAGLPVRPRLARLAGFLLIAIGAIILTYPLWPILRYKVIGPPSTPEQPVFPYESKLIGPDGSLIASVAGTDNLSGNVNSQTPAATKKIPVQVLKKTKPADNRLVIPKIGVNVPITEGADEEKALWKGVWHIPGSSNPIDGGNMVLSGHRFRYRPPSNLTLYLLNQVRPGDFIIVYWQGKEYDYKVSETKIVPKEQTDVAQPTVEPIITITTCHPLFSTKERLVVIGEII